MLHSKGVVLGVTGSIAAHKAVDIASKLVQAGLTVDVIMTKSATEFVTPLPFRTITRRPVNSEMFAPPGELDPKHIALAERADVVVIAPATANIIAKIASGLADDPLTCTVLATKAPVIIAPAMNVGMYETKITQENINRLRSRGFIIVGPAYGRLVTGRVGYGRLADVEEILGTIFAVLGRDGDLAEKRILVSAGGTQEAVDPVRYIGNRSSGKMGYAIAEAARNRGAQVTLVTAPTWLTPPVAMNVVCVETALQMRDAVLGRVAEADALIMAAAVADYRPQVSAAAKVKSKPETLTLELMRNPDILSEVHGDILKVGFAAETEDLVANARRKLKEKGLNLIVANDITAPDSGFEADTNRVVLIDRGGGVEELPLLPKYEVAHRILDRVVELLAAKASGG
jgi:phosphopantothenoylcysteine decarboxylase/phosphopantothenate--cysteine ligase